MEDREERRRKRIDPFPWQPTETEQERLRGLEKQQSWLEQHRVTPREWEEKPVYERIGRKAVEWGLKAPSSLIGSLLPVPIEWEREIYGAVRGPIPPLTPEATQRVQETITPQYRELKEKQDRAMFSNMILENLLFHAVEGEPVEGEGLLREKVAYDVGQPQGFSWDLLNRPQQDWLIHQQEKIAGMSRAEAYRELITITDKEELKYPDEALRSTAYWEGYDERLIRTGVAWAKDQESIVSALDEIYGLTPAEEQRLEQYDERAADAMKDWLEGKETSEEILGREDLTAEQKEEMEKWWKRNFPNETREMAEQVAAETQNAEKFWEEYGARLKEYISDMEATAEEYAELYPSADRDELMRIMSTPSDSWEIPDEGINIPLKGEDGTMFQATLMPDMTIWMEEGGERQQVGTYNPDNGEVEAMPEPWYARAAPFLIGTALAPIMPLAPAVFPALGEISKRLEPVRAYTTYPAAASIWNALSSIPAAVDVLKGDREAESLEKYVAGFTEIPGPMGMFLSSIMDADRAEEAGNLELADTLRQNADKKWYEQFSMEGGELLDRYREEASGPAKFGLELAVELPFWVLGWRIFGATPAGKAFHSLNTKILHNLMGHKYIGAPSRAYVAGLQKLSGIFTTWKKGRIDSSFMKKARKTDWWKQLSKEEQDELLNINRFAQFYKAPEAQEFAKWRVISVLEKMARRKGIDLDSIWRAAGATTAESSASSVRPAIAALTAGSRGSSPTIAVGMARVASDTATGKVEGLGAITSATTRVGEQAARAGIPFMVTEAMREQLSGLGYSQAAIDKMEPADAWANIINKSGFSQLSGVTEPAVESEVLSFSPDSGVAGDWSIKGYRVTEARHVPEEMRVGIQKALEVASGIPNMANNVNVNLNAPRVSVTPKEIAMPTMSEMNVEHYTKDLEKLMPDELSKLRAFFTDDTIVTSRFMLSRLSQAEGLSASAAKGEAIEGLKAMSRILPEVNLPEPPPTMASSTVRAPEGIEMPPEVQADMISRGKAMLAQVPDVKPNQLHTVGVSEGEVFIRTDAHGDVMVTGLSLMREGQLTLSNIVSASPGTAASSKALRDVGKYIEENNIAFPPREEMSPQAIKVYDKYVRKEAVRKAPAPEVATHISTTEEVQAEWDAMSPPVRGLLGERLKLENVRDRSWEQLTKSQQEKILGARTLESPSQGELAFDDNIPARTINDLDDMPDDQWKPFSYVNPQKLLTTTPDEAAKMVDAQLHGYAPADTMGKACAMYTRHGDLKGYVHQLEHVFRGGKATPPPEFRDAISKGRFDNIGQGLFKNPNWYYLSAGGGVIRDNAAMQYLLRPMELAGMCNSSCKLSLKQEYNDILEGSTLVTQRLSQHGEKWDEALTDVLETYTSNKQVLATPSAITYPADVAEKIRAMPGYKPGDETEIFRVLAQLRQMLDRWREDTNVVRRIIGQKEIPYREGYVSHMARDTAASKLIGLDPKYLRDLKERGYVPDYVEVSSVFDPFAQPRSYKIPEYAREKRLSVIIDRYAAAMSKDRFMTPAMKYANKQHDMLSETYPRVAEAHREIARTLLLDMPGGIDDWFRRHGFQVALNVLQRAREALTLSVFPLNAAWNAVVQPSSLALNSRYKAKNLAKALVKWMTDPQFRKDMNTEFTPFFKGEVSVAFQDVSNAMKGGELLSSTKLYRFVDATSWLLKQEEWALTGISMAAAYYDGIEKGLKGDELRHYASVGAAQTQSVYMRTMQSPFFRNQATRSFFPFMTFMVDAFNNMREYVGAAIWRGFKKKPPPFFKTGAWRERATDVGDLVRQLLLFLGLAHTFNTIGDAISGRKPWELRSWLPFEAQLKYMWNPYDAPYWAMPLPVQHGAEFLAAIKTLADPDIHEDPDAPVWEQPRYAPLREYMLRYWTPGGTAAEKAVDAWIAESVGAVRNSAGEELFEMLDKKEDPVGFIQSMVFGVYSTKEGREWVRELREKDEFVPDIHKGAVDTQERADLLGEKITPENAPFALKRDMGKIYTTSMFDSYMETLADDLGIEAVGSELMGYPELSSFWKASQREMEFYEDSPTEVRQTLRYNRPMLDALLFFWGRVDTTMSEDADMWAAWMLEHFDMPNEAIPAVARDEEAWNEKRKKYRRFRQYALD